MAYGSPNTCTLLKLHDIPESQVTEVRVGDQMILGPFEVEVLPGQHSLIPFGWVFNGKVRAGIKPPLRLQDYPMDNCLGYLIHGGGKRLLVCAARPQATDVLFIVAQESRQYYLDMFNGTRAQTIVLIHWDNFIRPLSKPIQRFTRPGRLRLEEIQHLAQTRLPEVRVIIPEWFVEYTL
jgi:L-ascorbate metabolism protein UlaG (beta-lactamase superfamily)